jgi:isoleucyl-tRNA synthetase
MPATGLDDAARSESIHLEEFLATDAWLGSEAEDQADRERWSKLMAARDEVLKVLEGARKDKQLGTGLEALIELTVPAADLELFQSYQKHLPALFIVSQVAVKAGERLEAVVKPAPGSKCERCWNYLPSVGEDARYPTVCARCSKVLETIGYTPSEAGAGANVS